MAEQLDDRELITAYLLGELAEPEQERFETRYFADDALFNRLLAIEDELIDRYSSGNLTEFECQRLERHFTRVPGRRKRLPLAEALPRRVSALAGEVHRQRLSWRKQLAALLQRKGPA